jgi:hypothetical protein
MDNKEIKIRVDVPELINSVLDQPAKTMGSMIADLLEIIFGGISYKKKELELKREHNFELFKTQLALEINAIPDSNRVEPNESIIGPALEAAKYRIEHKELREMFAKLIASSTDATKESIVHPSFVEILNNLSSDDAKAFEKISEARERVLIAIVSLPENILFSPNKGRHFCWLSDLFGFEKSNVILSSLLRSGIIEINKSFPKELSSINFNFDKIEQALRQETGINKDDIDFEYGFLRLSPLGHDFALTCSPKTFDELLDELEIMLKYGIGDTENNKELLEHFRHINK